MTFRLPRGLYHPALGLSLAWEHCLALDLVLLSMEPPPGSPSVEFCLAPPAVEFGLDHPSVGSCSVHPAVEFGLGHSSVTSRSAHPAVEFSCFSSSFVAWGLSWVLGSSPVLFSWVSSRAAAPWIHLLPHQVLVLSTSLVIPLGLPVCLDPAPAL